MADNTPVTPGSGIVIASDDIGGVQHQRVKVVIGADGVSDGDISASNPMPVTGSITTGGLTDTELRATAVPVSGTVAVSSLPAGTSVIGHVIVDSAPTTAVTGTFFQATQPVSLASSVAVIGPLTDTQLRATAVPVSGTVTANTGLTQPLTDTQIRATALPISGTITANAGTNLNTSALALESGGNLAAIKADVDKIPSQGQALAAASMPVVLPVAQITTLTPPAAITGFALEAGHLATIDTKTPALGQALAAASVPVVLTAAQITTLTPPSSVSVSNFPVTQPVSGTVAVSSLPATPAGTNVIGHVIVDSAPTTAVTGTFFQTTQPVSVATLPALATGSNAIGSITNTSFAATQATAANLNATIVGTGTLATQVTSLPALPTGANTIGAVNINGTVPISGSITATNPSVGVSGSAIPADSTLVGGSDGTNLRPLKVSSTGVLSVDGSAVTQPVSIASMPSTPVTGTFWQATQPVSASVLPLPTGAATAANQATEISSLSTIASNTTPINVAQGASITGLNGDLNFGSVTTAAPTYTTGTVNAFSLNTAGALRVDGSGTTQTITGTVTANASPAVFDFSSANLAAAATYTTQWFDSLTAGGGFSLSVFADQPITYNVQFSPDNGTTVRTMDTAVIPASTSFIETHIAEARYFRVSYTNSGASTTTALFLSTVQRDDPLPEALRITDKSGQDLVLNAKGVQGATALPTQDLKDSGRNISNLFSSAQVLTTATDALQSLTGYKSGAAVTATTTPAVVTTGKTFRVNNITLIYIATATVGTATFTLRANTAGVVSITSPIVMEWSVGEFSTSGTPAGIAQTISIPFPEGLEFAAGTGIGISVQGFGATGTATAVGYTKVTISGYEY